MFDVIIAAALLAGGTAADDQPARNRANRMICRRDEAAVGTRMAPRICRTAAEWDALRRGERSEDQRQSGGGSEDRTQDSPR
ncbi:MAG TPA: hypothetical protein VGB79_07115 [Allosphingosinicella sp.]|jgi:hypothetical protein